MVRVTVTEYGADKRVWGESKKYRALEDFKYKYTTHKPKNSLRQQE